MLMNTKDVAAESFNEEPRTDCQAPLTGPSTNLESVNLDYDGERRGTTAGGQFEPLLPGGKAFGDFSSPTKPVWTLTDKNASASARPSVFDESSAEVTGPDATIASAADKQSKHAAVRDGLKIHWDQSVDKWDAVMKKSQDKGSVELQVAQKLAASKSRNAKKSILKRGVEAGKRAVPEEVSENNVKQQALLTKAAKTQTQADTQRGFKFPMLALGTGLMAMHYSWLSNFSAVDGGIPRPEQSYFGQEVVGFESSVALLVVEVAIAASMVSHMFFTSQ